MNSKLVPVYAHVIHKDLIPSVIKAVRKKTDERMKGKELTSFPDIRDTIGGMFVVCGDETDLNNVFIKV